MIDPEPIWYRRGHPLSLILLPLSWLFCAVVRLRRFAYRQDWLLSHRLPVPVIVVGNLTVGGTGKTPLVIRLTEVLRQRGYRPGIVTRGYGGDASGWPQLVTPESDPFALGDEAVLLARRGGCPVAAGADRVAAARMLVGAEGCDIIVSDDGLQHYRLQRDLEILVMDAERGLGNGSCLPAGPLREPQSRRREADLTVCNGGACEGGWEMAMIPERLVNLRNPGVNRDVSGLRGRRVTAVAAIGNPGRFFAMLRREGLLLDERTYGDHHRFTAEDVASWPPGPVVMTEKDAVKCEGFAGPDHWYLAVKVALEAGFEQRLSERLASLTATPSSKPED
jgi:tetraacyldisaccharide 4'-kinase